MDDEKGEGGGDLCTQHVHTEIFTAINYHMLTQAMNSNRQQDTHTQHTYTNTHSPHCTCPGLISGLCRLEFECSPSTPETPAHTDTQAGLAGA